MAAEVFGKIDFETAAEGQIREIRDREASGGSDSGLGDGNPVFNFSNVSPAAQTNAGGIVDFKAIFNWNDIARTWSLVINIGADPADVDGLIMLGRFPNQGALPDNEAERLGRNILGMTSVFMPLMAPGESSKPDDGDIARLTVGAAVTGVAIALAQARWLNVERWILYGGEAQIRETGAGVEVAFFFDVETAV